MRRGAAGTVAGVAVILCALLTGCSGDRVDPADGSRAALAGATLAPGVPTPTATTPSAPASPQVTKVAGAARVNHEAPPVGCPLFPRTNIWHRRVDDLPVLRRSAALVTSIGRTARVHPDFGSGLVDGAPFGFPVTRVPVGQGLVRVRFDDADESDPGPYPVPRAARVEGGAAATGDRHVILYDQAHCRLYELYDAHPRSDGSWRAGSGAVYDLRSNRLRPAGWTSADAAGLPILPGLVQVEEVRRGRIDHAIRMTVPVSRDTYVWPARHAASTSADPALPPMGLRLRLKRSVDLSGLHGQALVVARAMRTYGVIVADNGSPWFISGTEDRRWDNDDLRQLRQLSGDDFEAVDTSGLVVSRSSGQAVGTSP